MKCSSKKICIFDLDGVLYNKGVYNYLDTSFCKDRKIIVCTGRGFKRTIEVLSKALPIRPIYIIVNNGASIIKDDTKIYEQCVKKRTIKRALKKLKDFKNISFINVITANSIGYQYFDPNNFIKDYNYYECSERFNKYNDFKEYCLNSDIVKMTIVFEEIDYKNSKKLNKLGFIKSDENMFCMIEQNINKLTAIKKIVTEEKYKLKDIIYFGNDYNDYCVFQNKKITSVYVYDQIDQFLQKKADYNSKFESLKNFLEEVDNI